MLREEMHLQEVCMLDIINTDKAPEAIGPYSQAVKAGSLLFVSGQIPFDPVEKKLVSGPVEEQAEQVLKNLAAVVSAGGSDMSRVIKTTVYLTNMNDFPAVNAIYEKHFGDHRPARACVAVKTLPKNVDVEIDAVCEV